jgi:hypothetical protein
MNINKIDEKNSVHHIVQLMANIINYLNVSLYQGQFTYNHEQSFNSVNDLYVQLSKTPFIAPSKEDIQHAYNNLIYLQNVTDTDDPDYHRYMHNLKKYIVNYNL